eukprot:gene7181-7023_t
MSSTILVVEDEPAIAELIAVNLSFAGHKLTDDIVEVHGLKLDPVTHRIMGHDKIIDMGPTEFRLLHFFMTHPERVHSRTQLLDQVWGDHVFVEERTVDVHIRPAIVGQMVAGHKGAVAGSILASLFIYALHVRSGLRIIEWLDNFKVENVPDVSGWWDDLAAKLFRYLRLHQRQQQALTNALVSFRTAAQALPDGVVTLDSEGHISWCNDTAQDHLGLKLGSDIGQPLINLVRNPNFSKYIRSRSWEQPLIMTAPRSRSKVLSVQLVSYGDKQMLVLSRDVTQVEKLERMRRDFIANVSHELKTPLTVLSGFLETFRDLPLSKEQQTEYLNLMYTQANRMQNLVEDLLALSALESSPNAGEGGEPLSAGKHNISVDVEKGLMGFGNSAEIFSAFSNIVTNAHELLEQYHRVHAKHAIFTA